MDSSSPCPLLLDPTSNYSSIYSFYTPYFQLPPSSFEKPKFHLQLPVIPLPVLKSLCDTVRLLFQSEPMLLSLNEPTVIVGDLHGHIIDLLRTLRVLGPPPSRNYLFLGDLVDRGEFSTETVILIFALKALFPNNVFCIRGNHEFKEMIETGGFSEELRSIYHSDDPENWILSTFAWIPIAATIGKSVLCVHGGIGPEVQDLAQISEIERPLFDYENAVVQGLLWSDPDRYVDTFQHNSRGIGYAFGLKALNAFLGRIGIGCLIRGHECVETGVEIDLEKKLFTVFGASRYCGQSANKSGVMIVEPGGKREVVVFAPIPYMLRSAVTFVVSEREDGFEQRKVAESRRSLPPRKVSLGEKVTFIESSGTGRVGMGRGNEGRPKLATPVLSLRRGGSRPSFGKV